MRTGSAEYSYKVLASRWVKLGFKSIEGYLWKEDERYDLPEESDLFRLLGIPYVVPELRNL
jgi:DNA polymerase/3'-5' exonuclease PolX